MPGAGGAAAVGEPIRTMNQSRPLKRVQEREFSAHHMLLQVARGSLEAAAINREAAFDHALVAITFSALSVEALCNAVGEKVVSDWDDFESLRPMSKLRLLAAQLNIEFLREKQPWTTLHWLSKFRNNIAHPKPEKITKTSFISEAQHDARLFEKPISRVEKEVTFGNARRAVEAVERLKEILVKNVPPEKALGLFTDGWSGVTTINPS